MKNLRNVFCAGHTFCYFGHVVVRISNVIFPVAPKTFIFTTSGT